MTTPLITRLEEAAEGSQSLDAEICIALQYGGLNSEGGRNVRTDADWEGDLLFEIGTEECCCPIPPVTTSLDAALALAEPALPGWDFIVGRTNGGLTIHAQVGPGEMQFGNTPALALCIAILKANHKDKP